MLTRDFCLGFYGRLSLVRLIDAEHMPRRFTRGQTDATAIGYSGFFFSCWIRDGECLRVFFFLLFCGRLSSARRNDAEQMPRRFTRRERRREESQISAQAALVHPRTLPVPTCVPDTACTSIFFISHAARLPRKPYILVYIHTYQV